MLFPTSTPPTPHWVVWEEEVTGINFKRVVQGWAEGKEQPEAALSVFQWIWWLIKSLKSFKEPVVEYSLQHCEQGCNKAGAHRVRVPGFSEQQGLWHYNPPPHQSLLGPADLSVNDTEVDFPWEEHKLMSDLFQCKLFAGGFCLELAIQSY